MRINRARDTLAKSNIKVGLAGLSGVGKTAVGAKAFTDGDPESVVICLTETQGEAVIRLHNPGALIVNVSSYAEAKAFWTMMDTSFRTGFLHQPIPATDGSFTLEKTGQPFKCSTVVLDTFSDLFRMVRRSVTERDNARQLRKYVEAKGTEKGFDDPEATSMQAWGIVQDKCYQLLQMFRDLPCNFLCLFSIDEREEEGTTTYRPFLQGRDLKSSVVGFFNAFGYQYLVPAKEGVKASRQVAFRTGPQFTTKGLEGLADTERASFRAWHKQFNDFTASRHETTTPVTPAPEGAVTEKEGETP